MNDLELVLVHAFGFLLMISGPISWAAGALRMNGGRKPIGITHAVVVTFIGFVMLRWGVNDVEMKQSIAPTMLTPSAQSQGQQPTQEAPPEVAETANPNREPWLGPQWPHAHRKTALDRVFYSTAADRKELSDTLASYEVTERLALLCRARTVRWGVALEHHLREVREDRATALGDPRGYAAVEEDRKNEEEQTETTVSNMIKLRPEKEVCASLLLSDEFADANDIVKRPLKRHHSDWEGAGGQ